MVGFDLICVGK